MLDMARPSKLATVYLGAVPRALTSLVAEIATGFLHQRIQHPQVLFI